LLVFGRGILRIPGGYALTAQSAARVDAAVRHVAANAAAFARAGEPRIVFTGGWPEASLAMSMPPPGAREGDLMLHAARAAGLHRHATLYAETRSRSTLENLVHTVEDGLLGGYAFGQGQPLGLVTHAWHLPRVRLLAGKVLHLPGDALLDIPATGHEQHGERLALLAARVGFLGAGHRRQLLRRERTMVAAMRIVRQLVGARVRRV
jgi:hypothetical protein